MADNLSTLSSDGLAGTPTGTGARYVLASTWENAQQTNLVTAGDTATLECYKGTTVEGAWNADGELNDNCNINGWTTGATNFITIKAAAGQEHNGVVDAGFTMWFPTGNSGAVLRIQAPYTVIQDIQLATIAAGYRRRTSDTQATDVLWQRVIATMDNTSTLEPSQCFFFNTSAAAVDNLIYRNCLAISRNDAGKNAGFVSFGTTPTNFTVENCTASNTYQGFSYPTEVGAAGLVITNCAATRGTNTPSGWICFNTAAADNAINCVSEDLTGTITGLSPTDGVDFVSPSTLDWTPTPTGLLAGVATDLSGTFTDDITNYTRTLPWDIGAYAIQAAGPEFIGPNIPTIAGTVGVAFADPTPDPSTASRFTGAASYALQSGVLPAGITVDPTTGNLIGTPDAGSDAGSPYTGIVIRGTE